MKKKKKLFESYASSRFIVGSKYSIHSRHRLHFRKLLRVLRQETLSSILGEDNGMAKVKMQMRRQSGTISRLARHDVAARNDLDANSVAD